MKGFGICKRAQNLKEEQAAGVAEAVLRAHGAEGLARKPAREQVVAKGHAAAFHFGDVAARQRRAAQPGGAAVREAPRQHGARFKINLRAEHGAAAELLQRHSEAAHARKQLGKRKRRRRLCGGCCRCAGCCCLRGPLLQAARCLRLGAIGQVACVIWPLALQALLVARLLGSELRGRGLGARRRPHAEARHPVQRAALQKMPDLGRDNALSVALRAALTRVGVHGLGAQGRGVEGGVRLGRIVGDGVASERRNVHSRLEPMTVAQSEA